ncbi:MAG: autotransporter assembly complex protein TamA [Alphaproteobacteria bacterium]
MPPVMLFRIATYIFVCTLIAVAPPLYAYEVNLQIKGDQHIEEAVKQHSRLWRQKGGDSVPAHQLRYRLGQDQNYLSEMLGAYGYYGGEVTGEVRKNAVDLRVETGPQFRFSEPRIEWEGNPPSLAYDFDTAGLKAGTAALSQTVRAARDALESALQDAGFLMAAFTCEKLVADHKKHLFHVKWCVDAGPKHLLSAVEVRGLTKVKQDYAMQLTGRDEGEKITPALRSQIAQRLSGVGLFDSVAISQVVDAKKADGITDGATVRTKVIADVIERPHRTVSAGLRYSTSEGAGVSLGWQHRNLLGRGERLGVEARLAQLEHTLTAKFAKPAFFNPKRTLRLGSAYAVEETDAYEVETIGASADIDQEITNHLSVTLGTALDTTLEQLPSGDKRFSLASVRAGAVYDTRDNVLEPKKGFRIGVSGVPTFGVIDTTGQFFKAQLSGSVYIPVTFGGAHIVALRAVAGSIIGGSRVDIPTDRLLFAGGGGSVRGFAYQSVGPKDAQGDPAGGRSLLEGSVELRMQITEKIGLVLFTDAGLVGPGRLPQTDDRLEIGVGFGGRYNTPAGPLRLDLGFPVSRRAGDDPVQIYISIGQAF